MTKLRRPMIVIHTAMTALCGIILMLAVLASTGFAAMLGPIVTTGHDQDIIVELGANLGEQVTNGELGSRHFYEDGLQASQATNPKAGLTQTVTSSLASGNVVNFAFQPFTENNILKFDAGNTGIKSLALAAPAGYRQLAVAYSGGSLSSNVATLAYAINYAGGGTQVGTIGVPDWGNVALPAGTELLVNAGRINMGAGTWNNQIPEGDTTANRWSVYVSEIAPNSAADILSIDFSANLAGNALSSSQDVVVFGLAGTVVPEPYCLALALFGISLTSCAAGRRQFRQ